VPYAARVVRADEVLTPMFVDFQIVGDAFAVRTIAENQSIRWMVEAKVFHEILQSNVGLICLRSYAALAERRFTLRLTLRIFPTLFTASYSCLRRQPNLFGSRSWRAAFDSALRHYVTEVRDIAAPCFDLSLSRGRRSRCSVCRVESLPQLVVTSSPARSVTQSLLRFSLFANHCSPLAHTPVPFSDRRELSRPTRDRGQSTGK
jgi:hypothetical protein